MNYSRGSAETNKEMLIIFDIDGTLCDTCDVDARCHIEAFESVTGRSLAGIDWSIYPEATSAGIVDDLLSEMDIADVLQTEQRIIREFLARLNTVAQNKPDLFRPVDGALELFEQLRRSKQYEIAIATGDWHASAKLKLHLSGFKTDNVPFASSSDTRRRADIIALAAARAGRALSDSIYVGDGIWDVKAARELGIRFIGIGKNRERLRAQGAQTILDSFRDEQAFFAAVHGS